MSLPKALKRMTSWNCYARMVVMSSKDIYSVKPLNSAAAYAFLHARDNVSA